MEDGTIKLISFVECVCGRPATFVRSGSFDEVATFLDGYTVGVVQHGTRDARADCLFAFGSWLSDTQAGLKAVPRQTGWASKIRALYPDEAEALRAVVRLYREFLEDPRRARQATTGEAAP